MGIYEDPTNQKTIAELSSPEGIKQFKPANKDVPNFNVTASSIWCRFLFTSKEDGPWLLEMGNPATKVVDIYSRVGNAPFILQERGLLNSKNEKELSTYHIFSHLNFLPGDTIEVFVKIKDVAPLQAYFNVGYTERFFESDHKTNLFHGLFYGMMILMVLYNLFLYFTSFARVYLYYVLYILFNTVFISFFVGHVAMLPPAIKHSLLFRVPVLVPVLFGTFGALFTMEFLYTKKLLPKMHKILWACAFCAMLIGVLSLAGFHRVGLIGIQLLGMVMAGASILTGALALKKCFRAARYYLFGYGAYLVGLMIFIAVDLEALPLFEESRYILEIGAIAEAIMLSFAIGDKLNSSNKEKNQAKEEALRAAQENERLIREQNVMLEQKVEERTRELNLQKQIVEEKNRDIISSIEYAKRIQKSLLPQEKYITRVIEKLKKRS